MSFPVAGTLMIEPTESESLAEIDAFCDAMIAVRAEVDKVASGEWDAADNPLKNAPHTAEMLIAGEWATPTGATRAATRAAAAPRVRAAGPSTGPRSAASTRPTATVTWSAPASRPRPTSRQRDIEQGRSPRRYTSGDPAYSR